MIPARSATVLHSMTGYGEAEEHAADSTLRIVLRSVNNRHLKVSVRGSDPYPQHEAEFEKLIRKTIRRGTVQIQIRQDRPSIVREARLNESLIAAYLDQLEEICRSTARPELLPPLATGILALPGMAPEQSPASTLGEEDWQTVERVLSVALDRLQASRLQDGRSMAEELEFLNAGIVADLNRIRDLLPAVVEQCRKRLVDRIRQALGEAGPAVEPEHLIREVAIFADRTDVSEEVLRLSAHAEQFAELVRAGSPDGAGRRLEFVVQEMGREINTLGSKAGDVAISRLVIEMKAALEKVRELIQNVE